MMRQTLFFLILISLHALYSCNPKDSVKNHNSKPNIIIILSDELQFEDISSFGGNIETPNIDALATEGMLFENAYTVAPMCTPSRFGLLSGKYPGKCAYPSFIKDNPYNEPYCTGWDTFIDSTLMTLPRLLSENGYITGMAGKWHLGEGNVGKNLLDPDGKPSDDLIDLKLREHQEMVCRKVERDAGFNQANSVMYENYDGFPVKALRYHNYPWITKGAIDFIEHAGTEKPFFLYLATSSVHGPHHAEGIDRDFRYTPEGKIEDVMDYQLNIDQLKKEIEEMTSPESHRYTGMAFMDHQIGLITAKIRELGIEKNTLILFLPDHNTEPAKATCYEKGIKIPMIMNWPGNVIPSSKTSALVSSIDIMPTILEIAGIPVPEEVPLDGKSFLTVLRNPESVIRQYIFAESGYTRSVSDGNFKYIAFRYPKPIIDQMQNGDINYAPNYVNKRTNGQSIIASAFYPSYFAGDQLFDLQVDPYEQKNLAFNRTYSEKLKELKQVLHKHVMEFNHPFPLEPDKFMHTKRYEKLVMESKKLKPASIDWYARDWGNITWPPEN